MKRSSLFISLLTISMILPGCDNLGKISSSLCRHEDKNKDHLCDICLKEISNHIDSNNDHICDVCSFKMSEHVDANKDIMCDVCGTTMSFNDQTLRGKLLKLVSSKNYTIQYSGSLLVEHSYFFTENTVSRYSSSRPDVDNTYYFDGTGTFQINYDVDRFVSSVYRSNVSPWEMENVKTLYRSSAHYFVDLSDDVTQVSIESKPFKIAFLEMIGYELTDFVNLTYLNTQLNNDNNILFSLGYDGNDYKYIVKDFGTTVDVLAADYVLNKGGKAYTVSSNYKKIITAFEGDNYCQAIYNFGETEETTGYVGCNYFTPGYFCYRYYSAPSVYYGYMSVNLKATEEYDATFGIYQFGIDLGSDPISVYLGGNVSESTDIPYVMSYIKYLNLWDNLHFLRKYSDTSLDVGFDVTENAMVTTESSIVNDFSYNFGMDSSFSGQKPVALTIDYAFAANRIANVVFYYTFTYGGYLYTMPFLFSGFGQSEIQIISMLYSQLNDVVVD